MLRHFIFSLVLIASPLQAADLDLLKAPGNALLLRHALAPGVGDPANFDLNDCDTQRNLSAEGRRQARQIGERLREAGISKTKVYSSQWCRCMETAALLEFGEPIPLPTINSFFRSTQDDAESKATAGFLEHLKNNDGEVTIYITHQVNLTALLGGFAYSGNGYIVGLDEHGQPVVLSEFIAD
ncbi:histidine phosphatase family protein [Methylophaga sp. OBS3]|uniref:histidine phosphatase family protein n=1 Tax=Methylophaga sp. OBS3 TaxID=2991934 RepID=UPI00224D7DA0|nr:histidine phosphatase family protein [Methylophaga sp. OBS3]MCX4190169.1 histidine phosphatase family protein [Methylophaga sp. OBS3]